MEKVLFYQSVVLIIEFAFDHPRNIFNLKTNSFGFLIKEENFSPFIFKEKKNFTNWMCKKRYPPLPLKCISKFLSFLL